MTLPLGASERSRELFVLAREVAATCPVELGAEIVLAGSVSRGWADEHSDIELNFWTEALPSRDERVAWLESLGIERIVIGDREHASGSMWMEFVYKDTWVEGGWHEIAHFDRLLDKIVAGEVEDMFAMNAAEMMAHAIPLRDGPHVTRWSARLREYPEVLRRNIIASATRDWRDSHHFELGMVRVLRPDATIAVLRAERTVHNVLAILFAINGQWQPDMRKWVREWADTLDTKPERLADRVLSILERPVAKESFTEQLALIAETLAVVPGVYGVGDVRRVVGEARERWEAWLSMS